MNPIVQFLLAQVFNILEGLIQSEGPALLQWLQSVLQSFQHPNPAPALHESAYAKPPLAAVNPFLQAFLSSLFATIETLISEGGPAALAWVEAEIAALEAKYGPQPAPVPVPTPTPQPVAGSVHPTLAPE